jgi:carbonic anhydrase
MFALSLTNILTALAVFGSARASCLHGTTFMPRNQDSVPIATFNYDGETGPLHWATLSPDNDACYSGNTQVRATARDVRRLVTDPESSPHPVVADRSNPRHPICVAQADSPLAERQVG